jgi:hypothetical protein
VVRGGGPAPGAARQAEGSLEEAYLYEHAIDRDAHVRPSGRLSEERALALLGRHDAELGGLDVEVQAFLVPTGLTWDGERFGTVATGLFFSRLAVDSSGEGSLVALRGFEPRFDG